jgi:RNase H-fold protein (predicted Holliday junction resolvase)
MEKLMKENDALRGNQNAIFDEIGNAFSDFGQSMQAMGSNQVCKTSRYFISVVKRFLYPINIYADVVTFVVGLPKGKSGQLLSPRATLRFFMRLADRSQ